jgi:alcohol oxidase
LIHITSANDIYAAPNFNTGFLSHPADIPTLIWGYKKLREILRWMTTFRAEIPATHPPFPPESAAAPINHYDLNLKDIEYSSEDDKILENWIRGMAMGTTWHSM